MAAKTSGAAVKGPGSRPSVLAKGRAPNNRIALMRHYTGKRLLAFHCLKLLRSDPVGHLAV